MKVCSEWSANRTRGPRTVHDAAHSAHASSPATTPAGSATAPSTRPCPPASPPHPRSTNSSPSPKAATPTTPATAYSPTDAATSGSATAPPPSSPKPNDQAAPQPAQPHHHPSRPRGDGEPVSRHTDKPTPGVELHAGRAHPRPLRRCHERMQPSAGHRPLEPQDLANLLELLSRPRHNHLAVHAVVQIPAGQPTTEHHPKPVARTRAMHVDPRSPRRGIRARRRRTVNHDRPLPRRSDPRLPRRHHLRQLRQRPMPGNPAPRRAEPRVDTAEEPGTTAPASHTTSIVVTDNRRKYAGPRVARSVESSEATRTPPTPPAAPKAS